MFNKRYTPEEIAKISTKKIDRSEEKSREAVRKACDKITRYMHRKRLNAIVVKLFSYSYIKKKARGVMYLKVNACVYSLDVEKELLSRGFCVVYNHENPHRGTYTVSVPK